MEPKFNLFPRHKSPGFVICQTATRIKAGLSRAFQEKGFNVTPEQWSILSSLQESDGIHQSALAERAAKDRHNVTRILNLLSKAGFVTRERHPADMRCQRVFLTDEGRTLQTDLVPIVTEFLSEALDGVSKQDLDEMTRILGQITRNLENISKVLRK
jgi:DNA-binding MarR family transcriptional regulator